MFECTKCKNTQGGGKFCGECGGELVAIANDSTTEEVTQQQTAATNSDVAVASNDTLNNIKEAGLDYWNYFMATLKKPSSGFAKGESEFRNGIINLIIFSVMFALSTYAIAYKSTRGISDMWGAFGGESLKPSFFPIFGKSLLTTVLTIAVILALVFVVNKLFGTDSSFKSIVSLMGYHSSVSLIASIVGLLLVLIGSVGIGTSVVYLGLTLIIGLIPIYILSSLLAQKSKGLDAFYACLIYLAGVAIVFAVAGAVLFESTINKIPGGLF